MAHDSQNPKTIPQPRRRWLRFSLRTMLLLVTFFGVWLGLQVKWIRDRREFLSQKGVSHFSALPHPNPFEDDPPVFEPPLPLTAPGLLWLLGEEGVSDIWFEATDDPERDGERTRKAEQLFPEASVSVEYPPIGPEENAVNPENDHLQVHRETWPGGDDSAVAK